MPSECARLLHDGAIDVGLIPSIEYLRGGPYRVVPDLRSRHAGQSRRSPSTRRRPSRTCGRSRWTRVRARRWRWCACCAHGCSGFSRRSRPRGPDMHDMLARCDAALIIGDNALFQSRTALIGDQQSAIAIEKIDLGEAWTAMTGLPFVWAFWAGRPDALTRRRRRGAAARAGTKACNGQRSWRGRIWRISRSVSSSQPVTCRIISRTISATTNAPASRRSTGTRSKPASLREQARYGFTDNARRILEFGIWN